MPKPETKAVATAQPAAERSLIVRIASRYHVDADKLGVTLKATVFRGKAGAEVTNEQLMMLLAVADQYKLNPFTGELFAFPSSERGIVPIVSVDGWLRIINERPELQSMAFEYSDDDVPLEESWCKCTIWRKDRTEPTVIKEYMAECKRNTGPWNSHPRRMLRHKTLIQCARIAFGYGGIYDQDEGERIIEATTSPKAGTAPPRAIKAEVRTLEPDPETPPPAEEPEPEQAAAPAAAGPKLDARTVGSIRKRLEDYAVPESELLAYFEIGAIEDLKVGDILVAIDWIKSESRAQ